MDVEHWDQVQTLFHEASERPQWERPSWLESQCGADKQLLHLVLAMLRADTREFSLLDRGFAGLAHEVMSDAFDSALPSEFASYRLKRLLGEGGMGVVWLAERTDAGNQVAVKFLPHAGLSPARRARFTEEIKTLAKLKHQFIARLYDAGTLSDGTPWFAMEYVAGAHLLDYCRQYSPSTQNLLLLFRAICGAVQYAHGQEIIHRDLKPSNIMVEVDGNPKLLDFGIARELQHGGDSRERTSLRFLSRDYAAPEWATSGVVAPFTDVYSLGVILYQMLTGQLPAGEKPSTLLRRGDVCTSQWRDLDALCLKAMHRDAGARYQSAEALVRDIHHYLNSEPLEARPDTLSYRARKFVERNRISVMAALAAGVVLAVTVVLFSLRLANVHNLELAQALREERIQTFMLNLFQGDDKDTSPSEDLRVVALIDRGVAEAHALSREPEVEADLYQTLGTLYQKLGKLDRAGELLRLSLKKRRALPELNHAGIAGNEIALSLLESEQGLAADALHTSEQALASINGYESRDEALTAQAHFAMGKALLAQGKNAAAADILSQLASFQSAHDPRSPDLARTLNALSDAHLYLGHNKLCEPLYRRALAIDRQFFGDTHPQVGDDLRNLAELQQLLGNCAEAERNGRESLRIAQAWYGGNHPDTAAKMTALAGTLIYEGKYEEADRLLRPVQATMERTYGKMSPKVAYVLNLLASVANKREDFKTAEAGFTQMTDIYRLAFGDADRRVTVAQANLASVYFKEKRYREAEPMFRNAVEKFAASLGADSVDASIARIKLGRTLMGEHRYRDAEPFTRAAYEALIKQTNPQTGFVQGARHDLFVIYRAVHQPDEARKFSDAAPADAK